MASKIDSRIVDHVIVIPGPYSALYGPGKQFVDVQLDRTPRFNNGFNVQGASSVDFRTNGQQWYGRQSIWGGDDVWGFRAGYGHRTGNDYESGDGLHIPSSYKSRDIDLALGAQVTPDSSFEGQALRLDQTDVELAGQAFDIDWLVTDGYEVEYVVDQPSWADRLVLEVWYNRTVLGGSAQRMSKREQFPFYNTIDFIGVTDVDSMSTGFRWMAQWEGQSDEMVNAGADLRYLKQELNEFTSGREGFASWTDANSPIPKSDYINPGIFVEMAIPTADVITTVAGGRLDYVGTTVLATPGQLSNLGIQSQLGPPLSAFDFWGSNDANQDDFLGMCYFGLEIGGNQGWGLVAKAGYSNRAANLTERYAVEPFMALIQNGLNTVTGDPTLKKEQLLQTDLNISYREERFRTEVVAFHAWVHDYITFEAMSTTPNQPTTQTEQVNLKYVNTDLATLWGCQARLEYDWNNLLTPFATLMYVQGDDRTRDGDFATQQAEAGNPSVRVYGLPRGDFSGITGNAQEPLPSIVPLESRLGLRWEERQSKPFWGAEVFARVVNHQDRVAASLLESTTPGFTTWDMRTFIRPRERWLFTAGLENFTNKQYREHLDYRSQNPNALSTFRPGISFYVGSEVIY
jgi:outer membrane receptor protein involved in Fe transport